MENDQPRAVVAFWLMPSELAKAFFESVIEKFATEQDAPVFEPHVTVYAAPMKRGRVADLLDGVVRQCEPIALQVVDVRSSARFTKSVFVQLSPSPALADVSRKLSRASGADEDYECDPHISLLYKTLPREGKAKLAAAVRVPFSEVRFDSVQAVWCPIPVATRADVEAWRVLHRARLLAR